MSHAAWPPPTETPWLLGRACCDITLYIHFVAWMEPKTPLLFSATPPRKICFASCACNYCVHEQARTCLGDHAEAGADADADAARCQKWC